MSSNPRPETRPRLLGSVGSGKVIGIEAVAVVADREAQFLAVERRGDVDATVGVGLLGAAIDGKAIVFLSRRSPRSVESSPRLPCRMALVSASWSATPSSTSPPGSQSLRAVDVVFQVAYQRRDETGVVVEREARLEGLEASEEALFPAAGSWRR